MYSSDYIDGKDYDPKFYVADTVGFGDWPKPKRKLGNRNSKIAVVYQTWGTPMYMPYIYHSMLSQIMYTDIMEAADTFLFVDEESYKNAKIQFKDIIEDDHIISEFKGSVVKYMIPAHNRLQKYDAVVIVDSDMFFWQTSGKSNFYSDILRIFQNRINQFIMLRTVDKSKDILEERRANLCSSVKKEDYLKFLCNSSGCDVEKMTDYMNTTFWYLSCIFAYSPKYLCDRDYFLHAFSNMKVKQYCDETVWITWAVKKEIQIYDLYNKFGWRYFLTYNNGDLDKFKEDKLHLIHPLTGPNRENDDMVDFIRKIQNDFIRGEY